MEVEQFREQICYITVFVALFILFDGELIHAASDGQTYIAESYFERYPTFIESEFSKFIANDIPLGLTKLVQDKNYALPRPRVSIPHRSVVGDGSHRHLSSSMIIKVQQELRSELVANSCSVIVIESLPSGVFADPFELQHLVQRNVFSDAGVFGDTNLELPSFRSNQSVVEIHMSVSSAVVATLDDKLEFNIKVPLHARYPPLGHGFSKVEFGEPDLLVCCNNTEGEGFRGSCLHMPIDLHSDLKANLVSWEIPEGIKEHTEVVSTFTFISALVAAFSVVIAAICYSDGTVANKQKHS